MEVWTVPIQWPCSFDWHCRSHNIAAECCVISKEVALNEDLSSDSMGGGDERESGLTVGLMADCMVLWVSLRVCGVIISCLIEGSCSSANKSFVNAIGDWPLKVCCRLGVVFAEGRKVGERSPWIPPVAFWSLFSSSAHLVAMFANCNSKSLFLRSICRFSASRASTSCRFRSLDDWAALRFLKTRSTRRCSFSSSVFARFLS